MPAPPQPNDIVTSNDTIVVTGKAFTKYVENSGNWNTPATWSDGTIPVITDNVYVQPGFSVTMDHPTAEVANLVIGGTLTFANNQAITFKVGTITVLATGILNITSIHAIAVEFKDVQPSDPGQYGNGLVVVGQFTVLGNARDALVRLTTEPQVGASQLALATPTNWQIGDEIFIPDSRHLATNQIGVNYVANYEIRTIALISQDGLTISLSSPLTYKHPSARNDAGTIIYHCHVVNKTRNIGFSSFNTSGYRAHMIATGAAVVNIQYAKFDGMGRTVTTTNLNNDVIVGGVVTQTGTNQIGRYPLHMHHITGAASPYLIHGCVITNSRKWPITIHGVSTGTTSNNVIIDGFGAGIACENAATSNSVISGNFVTGMDGTGLREVQDNDVTGWGRAGVGIWLGSALNEVRDNVTNHCKLYGYVFHGFTRTQAINVFADNEVYGAIESGLAFWDLGLNLVNGVETPTATVESHIINFRAWHFYRHGCFGYPSALVIWDDPVMIGDIARLSNVNETAAGIFHSDYEIRYSTVNNPTIVNLRTGIVVPCSVGDARQSTTTWFPFTINNGYLNNNVNVLIYGPASTGGVLHGKRQVYINNTSFGTYSISSQSPKNIVMTIYPNATFGYRRPLRAQKVLVTNYNQVVGDNFNVYFLEQEASVIVPQTSSVAPGLEGTTGSGMTNAQALVAENKCFAAEITPSTSTRSSITGFVGPSATDPDIPFKQVAFVQSSSQLEVFSAGSGHAYWTRNRTQESLPNEIYKCHPAQTDDPVGFPFAGWNFNVKSPPKINTPNPLKHLFRCYPTYQVVPVQFPDNELAVIESSGIVAGAIKPPLPLVVTHTVPQIFPPDSEGYTYTHKQITLYFPPAPRIVTAVMGDVEPPYPFPPEGITLSLSGVVTAVRAKPPLPILGRIEESIRFPNPGHVWWSQVPPKINTPNPLKHLFRCYPVDQSAPPSVQGNGSTFSIVGIQPYGPPSKIPTSRSPEPVGFPFDGRAFAYKSPPKIDVKPPLVLYVTTEETPQPYPEPGSTQSQHGGVLVPTVKIPPAIYISQIVPDQGVYPEEGVTLSARGVVDVPIVKTPLPVYVSQVTPVIFPFNGSTFTLKTPPRIINPNPLKWLFAKPPISQDFVPFRVMLVGASFSQQGGGPQQVINRPVPRFVTQVVPSFVPQDGLGSSWSGVVPVANVLPPPLVVGRTEEPRPFPQPGFTLSTYAIFPGEFRRPPYVVYASQATDWVYPFPAAGRVWWSSVPPKINTPNPLKHLFRCLPAFQIVVEPFPDSGLARSEFGPVPVDLVKPPLPGMARETVPQIFPPPGSVYTGTDLRILAYVQPPPRVLGFTIGVTEPPYPFPEPGVAQFISGVLPVTFVQPPPYILARQGTDPAPFPPSVTEPMSKRTFSTSGVVPVAFVRPPRPLFVTQVVPIPFPTPGISFTYTFVLRSTTPPSTIPPTEISDIFAKTISVTGKYVSG